MLFEAGHGTSSDLIYVRGVLDAPSPELISFDRKHCTLIIVEIGFYRDLGCDVKFDKKDREIPPPSSRPSEGIGDGWSSLPFPSATRVPHSPGP